MFKIILINVPKNRCGTILGLSFESAKKKNYFIVVNFFSSWNFQIITLVERKALGSVPDSNPDPPDPDMFLGDPDPDPLVRGMDPDPSIIKQK